MDDSTIDAKLDAATCYRAVRARDARFDGRFFTAVRTTGIFCRPICPARTPARANVDFYPSAAAAIDAGFRPCLRCRPELAPERRRASGTSALVAAALDRMDRDAGEPIGQLAARLGVSDRHLRRIFLATLGATPVKVAQARRALFARRLLRETSLPITRVAFAAGFASVRRFNAAIRATCGSAPGALRRTGASRDASGWVTLDIDVTAPYDSDAILAFLAARAYPGVETVDRSSWTRSFLSATGPAVVRVRIGEARRSASRSRTGTRTLSVDVIGHERLDLAAVVARARHVFDTAADVQAIRADLARDRLIAPVVRALPGLRVPGAWDPFEIAVRAIVGQQVSVRAATTLASRLVEAFGAPLAPWLAGATGLARVFPEPAALAAPDAAEKIGRLGIVRARAAAIAGLARAVLADPTLFDAPHGLEAFVRRLVELPGIGRWTAQYVAMRASGDPDAFPEGDLALLRSFSGLAGRACTMRELIAHAERWRPWRAYAALALWQHASTVKGDASGG